MKQLSLFVVFLLLLVLIGCTSEPKLVDINITEPQNVTFIFSGEEGRHFDNFMIVEIVNDTTELMWSIYKVFNDKDDNRFNGTLRYGFAHEIGFQEEVVAKPLKVDSTYKLSAIRGDFSLSWKFKLVKDAQSGKVKAILLEDNH